jgi:hypothetical protein
VWWLTANVVAPPVQAAGAIPMHSPASQVSTFRSFGLLERMLGPLFAGVPMLGAHRF